MANTKGLSVKDNIVNYAHVGIYLNQGSRAEVSGNMISYCRTSGIYIKETELKYPTIIYLIIRRSFGTEMQEFYFTQQLTSLIILQKKRMGNSELVWLYTLAILD